MCALSGLQPAISSCVPPKGIGKTLSLLELTVTDFSLIVQ